MSSERDRMRGTGGNRFIESAATIPDLMRVIHEGLYELQDWANDTGRTFDLAEVTISTCRIRSGRISVTVGADLAGAARPADDAREDQA